LRPDFARRRDRQEGLYLSKLLANNPDWVWTHESGIPLQDGFLNKWRLDAPVGDQDLISVMIGSKVGLSP
jgi:hypothetical protein